MSDVTVRVLQSFCGTPEQNRIYGNGSVVESVVTDAPWARLTDPKESWRRCRPRIMPMPEEQALALQDRKLVKIIPPEPAVDQPPEDEIASSFPKSRKRQQG